MFQCRTAINGPYCSVLTMHPPKANIYVYQLHEDHQLFAPPPPPPPPPTHTHTHLDEKNGYCYQIHVTNNVFFHTNWEMRICFLWKNSIKPFIYTYHIFIYLHACMYVNIRIYIHVFIFMYNSDWKIFIMKLKAIPNIRLNSYVLVVCLIHTGMYMDLSTQYTLRILEMLLAFRCYAWLQSDQIKWATTGTTNVTLITVSQ